MPISSQVRNPTTPPVASAPPTRPNSARKIRLPTSAKMNRNGSRLMQSGDALRRRAQFGLGQRLALDHAQDAIDAGVDAAVIIAALEGRGDVLLDDAIGRRVGQRALEPVADLDAHLAIIERDDQQDAVVHLLAAELPLLDDADRILVDLLGLRRRHDQHGHLAALRLLERCQLRLERRDLVGRERAGGVGDARGERRDRRERLCATRSRDEQRHRRHEGGRGQSQRTGQGARHRERSPRPRASARARARLSSWPGPGAVAGAWPGAGLNSTVGGLAIAASFSTAKFGFTL